VIDKLIRGEAVREILEYTGYETDELRESVAKQLSQRKTLGLISDDDEHEVLATFSRVLDNYTYLE
jgi:arginine decarboxylase-like protein